MKLLHTSDWHVGKTIRGRSRAEEHKTVLAEMADIADNENVDVIIVAGDLFETATPTAESEQIVYKALLDFANTGAQVVVIAGNHDNARRLEAVTPVFHAVGSIHVVTKATRPSEGGTITIETSTGETAKVAMLPFVSKRGIVKAAELWDNEAFENSQKYTDRVTKMMALLANEFDPKTINILVAHTFVHGQALGGGERQAHFVEEYAVTSQSIPTTANYVALGHVHKAQKVSAGSVTHYCGSPLQLDFGDGETDKQVNLVELRVGAPGAVTPRILTSGRRLQTLRGSLAELQAQAQSISDDTWLRVFIDQPNHAGLADQVRQLFGDRLVEVKVTSVNPTVSTKQPRRIGRSARELFAEYLSERNIDDDRLLDAFNDLVEAELDATQHVTPGGDVST